MNELWDLNLEEWAHEYSPGRWCRCLHVVFTSSHLLENSWVMPRDKILRAQPWKAEWVFPNPGDTPGDGLVTHMKLVYIWHVGLSRTRRPTQRKYMSHERSSVHRTVYLGCGDMRSVQGKPWATVGYFLISTKHREMVDDSYMVNLSKYTWRVCSVADWWFGTRSEKTSCS